MNLDDIVGRASRWVGEYFQNSPGLIPVFHDYAHTADTVAAARMIVAGMQVTGEDLETVLLACWFHDVGFLVASESHEERSVETARAFLGAQGVDGRKIDVVAACILATRMPQKPVGLLEEIICDADLSHLGGDNFLARNMLLRQEREWREGRTFTDREWLLVNQEFFDGHRYFTAAAHRLFDNGKKRNLARLAELLRGNCK